jgi:hypothetical protein
MVTLDAAPICRPSAGMRSLSCSVWFRSDPPGEDGRGNHVATRVRLGVGHRLHVRERLASPDGRGLPLKPMLAPLLERAGPRSRGVFETGGHYDGSCSRAACPSCCCSPSSRGGRQPFGLAFPTGGTRQDRGGPHSPSLSWLHAPTPHWYSARSACPRESTPLSSEPPSSPTRATIPAAVSWCWRMGHVCRRPRIPHCPSREEPPAGGPPGRAHFPAEPPALKTIGSSPPNLRLR